MQKRIMGISTGALVLMLATMIAAPSVHSIDRRSGRNQKPQAPRGKYDTPREAREKAAIEYYYRGMELEENQDWLGALANYDTAMFYDSESYTIRMSYIKTAAKVGKFQEARDQAGKLDLEDAEALRLIVDLYRQAQMTDSVLYYLDLLAQVDTNDLTPLKSLASYYEQLGNLAASIPYREKIAQRSNDYQAYNELGALQFLTENYDGAISSFKKSIEIEPGGGNIPSYSGLADALSEKGDNVRQRSVLGELLELDSTHVPTHRRFIDYYSRQRFFDSALIHSKIEVELTPQDKSAIRRLGIIAYSADSLDLAEDQFNELIGIGQMDFTNYFFLGRIFFEKENYSYAMINFRTATRSNDSISDGWLGIGQTYQAMDSLKQAASAYREGLSHVKDERDRIRLLFSLGATREQIGEMELSEKAFNQVLELDSMNAPALNYLGYMLVDRDDRVPYAKELIRRALEINPNSGAYIDSYAWALFKEGDYQQAKDSLHRALDLIQADPTVFDHLGDVYQKLGVSDSAAVYWRRALEKDSDNETIKAKLQALPTESKAKSGK